MINKLYDLKYRALFYIERRGVIKDPASWRAKHPILIASQDPVVTFMVPIFEKKRAPDWKKVTENIERTVRAAHNQTNSNWRMIICSQDKPENINFDKQVIFLRYPVAHGGASDKLQKLRHIARFMAEKFNDDGYAFFLDGDDIPHPSLVDFIVQDNNGHGYYVDQGYFADLEKNVFFESLDKSGSIKPFYQYCGSCTAVRFDARNDKSHVLHVALRGDHMQAAENLQKRVGLTLVPVPFPAMLYAIGHGTSDQDILKSSPEGNNRSLGLTQVEDLRQTQILSAFKLV